MILYTRDKKGITLIALIITVIVLLILASVSINMLTGENGLLVKTQEAKEKNRMATAKEKVELAMNASWDESGNFNKEQFKEEIKRAGGSIISEDENIIVVKMDIYEATINIKKVEIVEFVRNSMTIKCEIMPKEDIPASNRIIKIIAQDDKNGIKSIKTPDGKVENANEVEYKVTENGTYKFIIIDGLGNERTKNVIIDSIILPNFNVNSSISPDNNTIAPKKQININIAPDTQGVSIKTPDGNIIEGNSASYEVRSNGEYKFIVTDSSGLEVEKLVTVEKISSRLQLFPSYSDSGVSLSLKSLLNDDKNYAKITNGGICLELWAATDGSRSPWSEARWEWIDLSLWGNLCIKVIDWRGDGERSCILRPRSKPEVKTVLTYTNNGNLTIPLNASGIGGICLDVLSRPGENYTSFCITNMYLTE